MEGEARFVHDPVATQPTPEAARRWKLVLTDIAQGGADFLNNPLPFISPFGAGDNRKALAWYEVLNPVPAAAAGSNRNEAGKLAISAWGSLVASLSPWEPPATE